MAVVLTGRLSRGSCYEYGLAVGPIAAGFLLVPTLGRAAGREPPESWPQLALAMPALLAHFTHTSDSLKNGRWYTALTCSLCHADAAQRNQTLLSLLLAGWGPATTLGAASTAACFFSGSAAAALNNAGRDLQTRRWLDNSTGGWASRVTPRAARMYNAAGFWRVCGGSPGVFALLGADLCLTLEQARSLLRQWEEEPAARPHLLGSLAWLIGAISNTVSMVLAEQRALTHGQSLSGAQAYSRSSTCT